MDLFQIVVAAVAGLVGAAFGTILIKLFGAKASFTTRQLLMVGPIVAFSVGLSGLGQNQGFRQRFIKQTSMDKLGSMMIENLSNYPKTKEVYEGVPKAERPAFLKDKIHKGLKRLSDEGLLEWHELRRRMSSQPGLCSGLWNGNIKTEDMVLFADTLTDQELRQWAEFSIKSAAGEIEEKPYRLTDQAPFVKLLQEILLELPAGEKERFEKILAAGVKASSEDSCWAMIKIFKKMGEAAEDQRIEVLRYMSTL